MKMKRSYKNIEDIAHEAITTREIHDQTCWKLGELADQIDPKELDKFADRIQIELKRLKEYRMVHRAWK
jgi:hypothetical protein